MGPEVASSRCVISTCQLCVSAILRHRFSVAAAGSRSLRSICRAPASGLGITILERPVNAIGGSEEGLRYVSALDSLLKSDKYGVAHSLVIAI